MTEYLYIYSVCDLSCLTLCNSMDYSPPGSSVHGIFSRQEYWSGLPFPPPGDFPKPEIELVSLALAGGFFFFPTEPRGKPHMTAK